ncbi:hypothetical protein [Flavihumibacter sp.]|uniref:hypothetical protein n=1 Tax=Flavihumibacter sp. TaxID=1913981 RepID=UPI002FCB345A
MRKLICIFIITVICGQVQSQNLSIIDALHLNEELDYKTRKPTRIIERNTSFDLNDKESNDKTIKHFDGAGLLLSYEFYGNNDSLFARVTYVNDTVNRTKLSRVLEVWARNGLHRETSIYTYSASNILEGTTDLDDKGNIIRRTKIICNDKGHPTQLSLLDGNGKLFNKERATYFYNTNKVLKTAETSDGIVLSSEDSSKISLKYQSNFPNKYEVFNRNGDLVRWKGKNFIDKDIDYEREYVYDEYGNWIESKIFQLTRGTDGKPIRKIRQKVMREFNY